MTIAPNADIVLDVIRAADPARVASAEQRLRLDAEAASGDFDSVLSGAAADNRASGARLAGATAVKPLAPKAGGPPAPASKAAIELEAVILNNFIGAMLPQSASAYFGTGLAGDMWKSMLADRVARQVAQSGSTGIASRLLSGRIDDAISKTRHAATSALQATAPSAAQMSVDALSLGIKRSDNIGVRSARDRS